MPMFCMAKTVTQFSVFRFLLGAAESANFPAGVKAASEWFPLKERALAIGLLNAGSSAGAAFAIPLVSFIAITFNWQAAFVITGLMGVIWMFFWWKQYYVPAQHPRISAEELALIESDKEPAADGGEGKKTGTVWQLLKIRQLGCFIARILIDPCTYFNFLDTQIFTGGTGAEPWQVGLFCVDTLCGGARRNCVWRHYTPFTDQ